MLGDDVGRFSELYRSLILALRGDHEQVRSLLASASSHANAMEYRSVAARARHAAGMATG